MKRPSPAARKRSALVLVALFAPLAQAGVLLDSRFEDADAWSWSSYALGPAVVALSTQAQGTLDSRGGQPGKALQLSADASPASGYWGAGASTGWLSNPNGLADLAQLTLAFDLWCSSPHPVRFVIKGFDAAGQPTGSLEGVALAPAAAVYHRQVFDLDTLRKAGGNFNGQSRYLQIQFEISNDAALGPGAWPNSAQNAIRVDNISLTAPSFFVDAQRGSDQFSGRTADQAFATIQHALDQVQAGDTVMVRDGTYTNAYSGGDLAALDTAGTPSRWIVLRNFPGHRPLLTTTAARPAWNGLRLNPNSAYVEIRGLHLRGNNYSPAITLAEAEADSQRVDGISYFGNPLYNGNGIAVMGKRAGGVTAQRPHHVRIIGNTVNAWGGGGIAAIEADQVTLAHNRSYDNAWYSAYACSGVSIFHAWNFSTDSNYRYFVLGNVAHGNRSLVTWASTNPRRLSDGNGFIIDDFHNTQSSSSIQGHAYSGRVLVQNNLSINNGGGGIQVYKSSNADIINNTAFRNSTELAGYGEIFANQASGIRFSHNILWARPQRPLNVSTGSDIVFSRNRYFGDGGNAYALGVGDSYGDPAFVHASIDFAAADFRPGAVSAVVDASDFAPAGVPRTDLDGLRRPRGAGVDLGAYESIDRIFQGSFQR